jgi:HK97 family phage portal protein
MDATLGGQDQGAMSFTAYFSGVLQISQTIASVDAPLLKITNGRRSHWATHPVYKIFNDMANPWVDSFKYRENVQMQALNYGDSYSFIWRGPNFRPTELYILNPEKMKIEVLDTGEPKYIYTDKNGDTHLWNKDQIFHLSAFGPTVYEGYSLIELFRKAIALGQQQEDFGNNFIKNGVHTSGVVTHPGKLSEEAHNSLKKDIESKNSGSKNAGRILLFEEGMTWESMSMPLKDAEFLGSRVFQIQEMARILNMPPHKLKDNSQATFSNITEQQLEWLTDTLRPWFERWEKAIDTQLLTPTERKQGRMEHNVNRLLRGDLKATMEAIRIGRFAGILSADDGLDMVGRNPLENETIGKRIWQPSNMMDASSEAAANGGGGQGGQGGEREEMVQDSSEE